MSNFGEALFSVLFYLIPPAHAPNHGITCNLCHTFMKALLVEPLLLLPLAQPIVLVLLSQLSPTHPPQFGDDSPRKNQRMQTGFIVGCSSCRLSPSLCTNSTGLLKRRLVELNSKSFLWFQYWKRRNDFEFNSTNLRCTQASCHQAYQLHSLP